MGAEQGGGRAFWQAGQLEEGGGFPDSDHMVCSKLCLLNSGHKSKQARWVAGEHVLAPWRLLSIHSSTCTTGISLNVVLCLLFAKIFPGLQGTLQDPAQQPQQRSVSLFSKQTHIANILIPVTDLS